MIWGDARGRPSNSAKNEDDWCHRETRVSPSVPVQRPPVQQRQHIPPAVANDVYVGRLLSDFVDDVIHAGNDLAVLGLAW